MEEFISLLGGACGHAHGPRATADVPASESPIHFLKQATAEPHKMRIDDRVAILDEFMLVLERNRDKFVERGFRSHEDINKAVADTKIWRENIAELAQCKTPEALREAVMRHWDSPIISKILDPDQTRTGCYVREAFRNAAQRAWFDFLQVEKMSAMPSSSSSASSSAPPAKRRKQNDEGDDASDKKSDQEVIVVDDEPLD